MAIRFFEILIRGTLEIFSQFISDRYNANNLVMLFLLLYMYRFPDMLIMEL